MKKILTHLYIAAFFLLLLIPGLGMLLVGEAQPAANEILASRPRLINRDGSFNTGLLSDFSDYIADRFAFRQELVTAWARLNAALLHTSVEEQVLLGEDGWLYYAATVDDYRGLGLTDGELRSAARNLALMQEYAQSQGADFLFTIAPNKNSLYPAKMPAYIPENHAASNAARLPAFLTAEGVAYADLFSAFAVQDEVLYYRTDSHWTNRGAALAADTLLAALGRESNFFPALSQAELFPHLILHRGDLYEMLYPTGKEREEELSPDLNVYTTDSDPNGGEAITIRSHSDGSGVLLCFRDSFGIALYPYLAANFGEALFSRQAAYDLTQLASLEANTLLIELVERNLGNLLTQPAIFPAPERPGLSPEAREGEPLPISLSPGASAGTAELVQIRGSLPADAEAGQPVYVRWSGRWYEALVTQDASGKLGFSAWLPANAKEGADIALSCGGATFLPCAAD